MIWFSINRLSFIANLAKDCLKISSQNLSQNLNIGPFLCIKNRHISRFCRKILMTNSLIILVNFGSNDQFWIETLGIETIFAQLRLMLSQCTQLYQNQPFRANIRRNQAFWATVWWVKTKVTNTISELKLFSLHIVHWNQFNQICCEFPFTAMNRNSDF